MIHPLQFAARNILRRRAGAARAVASVLMFAILVGACASPPLGDGGPPPALPEHLADPPQDADGWLRAADRAEAARDWPAAAYCLDRLAEEAPDTVDAAYLERRAGVADRTGDLPAAIAAREQLVSMRPDDLGARIDLADDLGMAGRLQQAEETLAHPFPAEEDRRLSWEAALLVLERSGRYAAAAGYAERLARDPGTRNPRVWWQRASGLYEDAGDLPSATAAIRAALEGVDLRQEEERALQRLDAFHRGDPQSVADAVALLRFHPDADARLVGMRFLSGEDFEDALPVFEAALRDDEPRIVTLALAELADRAPRGRAAAVRALLASSEGEVRLAAIDALGALGEDGDFELLYGELQPDDRARFRAARRALEALTGHVIGVGLDPDLEQRRRLREAWGAWRASGEEP